MNVLIRELWAGDRFEAHGNLWTYIGAYTARKHCGDSRRLGLRGFGYIGDTICRFEPTDKVIFVPPNDKPTPLTIK